MVTWVDWNAGSMFKRRDQVYEVQEQAKIMKKPTRIHSIDDSERDPRGFKASMSPETTQASDDLEAIREGLAQSLAGLGRPAEEFFSEFERDHHIKPMNSQALDA